MLKAASLLATGLIVGTLIGFPSGFQTYAALDAPTVHSVVYSSAMRKALTHKIERLNRSAAR